MSDTDQTPPLAINIAKTGESGLEARKDQDGIKDAAQGSDSAQEKFSGAEKEGANMAELLRHHHRRMGLALDLIGREAGLAASATLAGMGAGDGGMMPGVEGAKELVGCLPDIRKAANEVKARVRETMADMQTSLAAASEKVRTLATDMNEFWDGLAPKTAVAAAKREFDDLPGQIKSVAEAAKPSGVADNTRAENLIDIGTRQRRTAGVTGLEEETITRMTEAAPPLRHEAVAGQQKDSTNLQVTGKTLAGKLPDGGSVDGAQAQFLAVLEQSITGHKLTLDQAVALLEAHSRNANSTLTLLSDAYTRIAQVTTRLEQLEARHSNARNTGISG